MLMSFVVFYLLPLALMVAAGYVFGVRVGRAERRVRPAVDGVGWRVEVYDRGGLVYWHRLGDRSTRDSVAAPWRLEGFAVLVGDPGERPVCVWGTDWLEEWESVWAFTDRPR